MKICDNLVIEGLKLHFTNKWNMQSNLSLLTARIMPSEKAPVAFKLNTAWSLKYKMYNMSSSSSSCCTSLQYHPGSQFCSFQFLLCPQHIHYSSNMAIKRFGESADSCSLAVCFLFLLECLVFPLSFALLVWSLTLSFTLSFFTGSSHQPLLLLFLPVVQLHFPVVYGHFIDFVLNCWFQWLVSCFSSYLETKIYCR